MDAVKRTIEYRRFAARTGPQLTRLDRGGGAGAGVLRERRLLRAWRQNGDRQAREQLLIDNLPLLRQVVRRYETPREQRDDLLQVAAVGLVKAIDRFDLDRGIGFRTYAVAVVCGELARYRRDLGWAVHVPRDLKQLASFLSRRLPALAVELQRSPTVGDLARDSGASEEAVVEALEVARNLQTLSLSDLAREDGDLDHLAALALPDRAPERVEQRQLLEGGLRALPAVQRRIVGLRFYREWTQEQIAREVGISQMHVSRLLRQALAALERELRPAFADEAYAGQDEPIQRKERPA